VGEGLFLKLTPSLVKVRGSAPKPPSPLFRRPVYADFGVDSSSRGLGLLKARTNRQTD